MSRFDTPLFDIAAWRERMDGRWFDSGAQLAESGAVDLVAIEDDLVTAHVKGGELYVVTLRAPDGEGACTCPGFEKFGACKHQAAVVVAANLLDATGRQLVQGRLARLRDGLALESREALIERLVDLAKKDPKVLAGLES
jgi:uncharacterized Zn finger protein